MDNRTIAATFDEMASLLEFQGANPFRIRAYRKAAAVIREHTESMAAIASDPNRSLTEIDGIGKDLAQQCAQLIEQGELRRHKDLLAEVPVTLLDLLRIPGLGGKKAARLFRELGVTSLPELRAACRAGAVRQLDGFGLKTEAAILEGIAIAEHRPRRMLWAEAEELVEALVAHLRANTPIDRLEIAGSYRRRRDTVGDVDLLAVAEKPDRLVDTFLGYPGVAQVIARGATKVSVRLIDGFQVDLRIVPADSFGAAWQYFTGSQSHNVALRSRARRAGLLLNEYGLFETSGDEQIQVAGRTEEEIYATLNLPWIPPELREDREEFEWASSGETFDLIDESDVLGDLHMHTTDSDGKGSIEQMAEAARNAQLDYIAITDHSRRVSMANGLDATRLREQWATIDRLNDRLGGNPLLLKGIECDILESGEMDLADDVLAEADWVLASIHYGQKQPRAQITERLVGALANRYVSALAHPSGRLLERRDPYDFDFEEVLAAAVKYGKCLELNANPRRLDLHDVHCAAARHAGVPIVINSDAHRTADVGRLRYGIAQARRGGLAARHVANTWSWLQLREYLDTHSSPPAL